MKLSYTCKKIILVMTAISLTALGIGSIFTNDLLSYTKGILFGTLFAILKVILLERTINKSVDMPSHNAQNYARLHYTLRYFLTGVVLAIGALEPSISFIGVVIPILTLQPAVYIVNTMYKDKI